MRATTMTRTHIDATMVKALAAGAQKFMEYFQREWAKKTTMFIRAFRRYPHAGADTSGAIEAYHAVIKVRFLSDKTIKAGRRIDWLLNKLLEQVIIMYEKKMQMKSCGLIQNKKNINRTVLAITHANSIPDENVATLPGDGSGVPLGDGVIIFSVQRPGHRVYVVRGLQLPGSLPGDFLSTLTCDCIEGKKVGPYRV